MKKVRRITIIISSIVILILCFITGSYLSMSLLIGMLMTIVFQGITLLVTRNRITVKIDSPAQIQKEKISSYQVIITNTSIFPVFRGSFTMETNNILVEEIKHVNLDFSLSGKGSQKLIVKIENEYCGQINLCMKNMRIGDSLGLIKMGVKCKAKNVMLVLPKLQYITQQISSKTVDSDDLREIRNYIEGDDLRSIHWKLSAKLDELMVREWDAPRYNTVSIVYEYGKLMNQPKPQKEDIDLSLEFTYAILFDLVKNGYDIQLYWARGDGEYIVTDLVSDKDKVFEYLIAILKTPRCWLKENTLTLISENERKEDTSILYITPYQFDTTKDIMIFDKERIKKFYKAIKKKDSMEDVMGTFISRVN